MDCEESEMQAQREIAKWLCKNQLEFTDESSILGKRERKWCIKTDSMQEITEFCALLESDCRKWRFCQIKARVYCKRADLYE
jgi:hypothetical protein